MTFAPVKPSVQDNTHRDWYSRVHDEFIKVTLVFMDVEIISGQLRGVQDRTPPLQLSSLKQVPKADPCSL